MSKLCHFLPISSPLVFLFKVRGKKKERERERERIGNKPPKRENLITFELNTSLPLPQILCFLNKSPKENAQTKYQKQPKCDSGKKKLFKTSLLFFLFVLLFHTCLSMTQKQLSFTSAPTLSSCVSGTILDLSPFPSPLSLTKNGFQNFKSKGFFPLFSSRIGEKEQYKDISRSKIQWAEIPPKRKGAKNKSPSWSSRGESSGRMIGKWRKELPFSRSVF